MYNTTVYTENPKESTGKLLELPGTFASLPDIKPIYRNQLHVYLPFNLKMSLK